MKKVIAFAFSVVLILACTAIAFGQSSTLSSLTGLVNDPTGATVAGATVTLKNKSTGEEKTTKTTDAGEFVFTQLGPGQYSVTVEATSFKKALATNIQVQVGNPARVTIALEVGSVAETVTVTTAQEVINTLTPALTTVINTRQVQDLPLPTRNPLDLAGLQPGVAVTGTDTRGSSISGLRQTAVNLTQDGINAMDNFVKTSSLFAISAPSLNSTSEFSVTTGTTESDSGRGVAQVRLVTRGGTNDFHGEGFYLVRSDSLEANDFFNNLTATPRPKEHQHFFGFSMGGPMFFPKVGEGGKGIYNLRDKAFWFVSYEGFRENFAVTRNRTVLTDIAKTGLFRYTGSNGATQTVNLLALGTASTLNPNSMAQINAMPSPNNSLVGDSFNTSGYRFNVTGADPNDKWVFRYDHIIAEKSKLGGHKAEFVFNRANFLLFPDTFNSLEAPFSGGTDAGQSSVRWLLTAADHMTFGNVTNELRWGRQWSPVNFIRDGFPGTPFIFFASALGGNAGGNPAGLGSGLDNAFLSQGRTTTVTQIIDNLAVPKGNHTLRFGVDYQQVDARTFNDAGINQTITLGSNSSNPNGISAPQFPFLPSGTTGTNVVTRAQNLFADLTGLLASSQKVFNVTSPTSGFVPGATRLRLFRERDVGIYAQDQWRARHNLTLNLGLRWEFLGVPTVPDGVSIQLTRFQDLFGITGSVNNLFNPTAPAGAAPAQGVLNFVSGDTGIGIYKNDLNNFAPFFGFAYSPDFKSGVLHKLLGSEGTSSIRGGYSISYLRDGFTTIINALGTGTTNPGLIQTAANTTPTGVLAGSGVPLVTPTFVMPITDRQNNVINPNNGLWAVDPNLRIPYVQQWSFGIEREIGKNMAFEARYVGNHAIKVWRAVDYNEINIFENGFLGEFKNAQRNLSICQANSAACIAAQAAAGAPVANQTSSNFGNLGLAGQVPLPIMTKFFNGLTVFNANGFASSGFVSNLANNNIGTMGATLAQSNTYRTARENAALGIPANFFEANPNALFARALTNDAMSNYNALELEVRRRLSGGLQFQLDYTFSKALSDARDAQGNNQNDLVSFRTLRNKSLDYTINNQDQRHRFVGNAIYDFPFGNGKRFLTGANGVVNRVVGGWSVGSIVTWQTRPPIYVASNRATVNNFNAGNNPVDLVGITFEDFKKNLGIFRTPQGIFFINPTLLNITVSATGAVSSVPKPGLFGAPNVGYFGNFPINSLRGPSYFNWDASLVKRIPIAENVRLEIKTTFINALNHANFAYSTQNIDSTSFGRITATSGSPRIIHFTFKLSW
jgi:hypothetical protein